MQRLRTRQFRRAVGVAAVLGAVLNAWVLAVHITSVALTSMHASGGGIAICHQGEIKYVFLPDAGENPASKKSCPICSGLANLQIGIVGEYAPHVSLPVLAQVEIAHTSHDLVADHRPRQTLNRGPPLLA